MSGFGRKSERVSGQFQIKNPSDFFKNRGFSRKSERVCKEIQRENPSVYMTLKLYLERYIYNFIFIFTLLINTSGGSLTWRGYGPRGHFANKIKQNALYFDLVVMCSISSRLSVIVKFWNSKLSAPFVFYVNVYYNNAFCYVQCYFIDYFHVLMPPFNYNSNYNNAPILYKGFGFGFIPDLVQAIPDVPRIYPSDICLYYSVLTINPYIYIPLHHSRYCSQLKNGG